VVVVPLVLVEVFAVVVLVVEVEVASGVKVLVYFVILGIDK
jgi:hypothetical protein